MSSSPTTNSATRELWRKKLALYFCMRAPNKTIADIDEAIEFYATKKNGDYEKMMAFGYKNFGPDLSPEEEAVAMTKLTHKLRLVEFYRRVDSTKTEQDVIEAIEHYSQKGPEGYSKMWRQLESRYRIAVAGVKGSDGGALSGLSPQRSGRRDNNTAASMNRTSSNSPSSPAQRSGKILFTDDNTASPTNTITSTINTTMTGTTTKSKRRISKQDVDYFDANRHLLMSPGGGGVDATGGEAPGVGSSPSVAAGGAGTIQDDDAALLLMYGRGGHVGTSAPRFNTGSAKRYHPAAASATAYSPPSSTVSNPLSQHPRRRQDNLQQTSSSSSSSASLSQALAQHVIIIVVVGGINVKQYRSVATAEQYKFNSAVAAEVRLNTQLAGPIIVVRVTESSDGLVFELETELPPDVNAQRVGDSLIRKIVDGDCSVAGVRSAYAECIGGNPQRIFFIDGALVEYKATAGIRATIRVANKYAAPLMSSLAPSSQQQQQKSPHREQQQQFFADGENQQHSLLYRHALQNLQGAVASPSAQAATTTTITTAVSPTSLPVSPVSSLLYQNSQQQHSTSQKKGGKDVFVVSSEKNAMQHIAERAFPYAERSAGLNSATGGGVEGAIPSDPAFLPSEASSHHRQQQQRTSATATQDDLGSRLFLPPTHQAVPLGTYRLASSSPSLSSPLGASYHPSSPASSLPITDRVAQQAYAQRNAAM